MVAGSNTLVKDETVNQFNCLLGGASVMNFGGVEIITGGTESIYTSTKVPFGFRINPDTATENPIISKHSVTAATGNKGFVVELYNNILTIIISEDGLTHSTYAISDAGALTVGEWHTVNGVWESTGSAGLITVTIDGTTYTKATTQAAVKVNSIATIVGAIRDYSPKFRGLMDSAYLGNCLLKGNQCGGGVVRFSNGSYGVLSGAVLSTFWSKDDEATPHNLKDGYYLYGNGTAGQEQRVPWQEDICGLVGNSYFTSTNTEQWTINFKQLLSGGSLRFMFMSGQPFIESGYGFYIQTTGNVILEKHATGGLYWILVQNSTTATDALRAGDCIVKITRSVDGVFNIYFDDVLLMTATDTQFSTSSYFVYRNYGTDAFVTSILDQNDAPYVTGFLSHPYQLIGYTLSGYTPPLVFGPWEGFFKAPDEALLKDADIHNFLYDGLGVAKEIDYAALVAGGGDPGMDTNIQYDQSPSGYFTRFRVRDLSPWFLLDELGDPILDEFGKPIVSF